jgi:MFS family permease
MGLLYLTATSVLPQWFSQRRSLAVGIASSGAGVGGIVYNLVAGAAAESVGLPWTYRILAFCSLGVNLICALLLKDRNKIVKPSQRSFDVRELAHVEVVLLITWGIVTELGYIVLWYSLPHYATSIGLTQTQGSVVGALLNLGLAVGRPIVGHYSDRFGRINMATVMTALCGIFCLAIWAPAKTYPVLLVFALLVGMVCGTFWATIAPVTAEVVGMHRLPSTFGIICLALVLPTTFAEPIALQIVDTSGYLSSKIFVGCMFLLGAACTFFLRSWKIADIEKKAFIERGASQFTGNTLSYAPGGWLAIRTLFCLVRV